MSTLSNPTQPAVTLKDLSQHLGLSSATISIVLSGSPRAKNLRAETRERVRRAARDLGYRPNGLARSLRVKKTHMIGVLVPRINSHYGNGVMTGLEGFLQGQGYTPLAISHGHEEIQAQRRVQTLVERQIDGLVTVSAPEVDAPVPTISIAGYHAAGREADVTIDHDRAVYRALAHLQQLGHRRIAFFKGNPDNPDTGRRWRAAQTAARSLGLEILPELVLQMDPARTGPMRRGGYGAGFRLGRQLLDSGRPFTALFAFNDFSAIGAMRAFAEAGLSVPRDVSVVGFDDVDNAEYNSPGLTTVRQPLEAMGELAGRLLLAAVDPKMPQIGAGPRRLDADLIIRGSTAAAAA
ncbi:MAG: LacI family DNA-binding transcriptional regulator [Acidobacteriota bacterium]